MTRLGAPEFKAATVANSAVVAGQALRTLLLARILNPATFGILNITNIGSNLMAYADLGAGIHGERVAAVSRGDGDLEQSRRDLIDAAGARMFPALVLTGIFGVAGTVAYATGQPDSGLPLVFLAISAPLMALWMACRGWLHVHGRIRSVMWCQLSQIVAWLSIVPACALFYGLPGALYAMAASYLLPIAIAGRQAPLRSLVVPRWSALRRLVGQGLALWFIMLSSFAFVNVDQALIYFVGGPAAVGYYAIALLVASALAAFSDGAAFSGHVKTLEAVARRGYLSVDIPSVTTVMRTVQAGFGVIVPAAWLGAALMIHFFLPQYLPGLPVVALLGAAMSLVGVVVASNSALLSVNRHRVVPVVYLGGAALKALVVLCLTQTLSPIISVGFASLLGSAAVALVLSILLSRAFEGLRTSPLSFCVEFLSGGVILSVLAAAVVIAFLQFGVSGYVWASSFSLVISSVLHAGIYLVNRRKDESVVRDVLEGNGALPSNSHKKETRSRWFRWFRWFR